MSDKPAREKPHLALPLTDRVLIAVMAGGRTVSQARFLVDMPEAEADAVVAAVRELRDAGRLQAATAEIGLDTRLSLPPLADDLPWAIDRTVRDAIPPHSYAEVVGLATRILLDGLRPRLTLWHHGERAVLADGHVAAEICLRWGKEYDTSDLDLPARQAVIQWRADAHYGGRSVTQEWRSWWRGTRFCQHPRLKSGRPSKSSDARTVSEEQETERRGEAAAEVAARYGVSRSTIYLDEKYSGWIDRIAKVAGDDARQELLARRHRWWRLSRGEVQRLAGLGDEAIKAAAARMRNGERPDLPPPAKKTRKDETVKKKPQVEKPGDDPPAVLTILSPKQRLAAGLYGEGDQIDGQVARQLLAEEPALLCVAEEVISQSRSGMPHPTDAIRPDTAWLSHEAIEERILAWQGRGEGHDARIDASETLVVCQPGSAERKYSCCKLRIDGRGVALWPADALPVPAIEHGEAMNGGGEAA